MRYFLRVIFVVNVLIFSSFPVFAQRHQKGGAELTLERDSYNYGDVPRQKNIVECEFPFTNTGTQPLVILNVKTSCSCLKAEFSRKPVKSGEKGVIKLLLEANKMDDGAFYRVIQILSNSKKRNMVITVQGNSVEVK